MSDRIVLHGSPLDLCERHLRGMFKKVEPSEKKIKINMTVMNHSNAGINVKQAVPFFMVSSMDQSLNYYSGGLGFQLIDKWEPNGKIEWCLLQLENVSMMLQEYRQRPPDVKLGEGVSVCFICEDALSVYEQIIKRGLQPAEPFVGNNMWVVGLTDPDGYSILFESPTEVQEETLYSAWLEQKNER